MMFDWPIHLPMTPRHARLLEWAARIQAQLDTLTPAEQRRARELARTTVLSIEQAIAYVRKERPHDPE